MRDTALSISTRTGTITSDLAPRYKAFIVTRSMRNSRQVSFYRDAASKLADALGYARLNRSQLNAWKRAGTPCP